MKTLLLLPLLIAAPAFAGTSAKQVVAPAPDPCITSWFVGASVGYMTQLETPLYTAHVGVTNSCWNVAGWNIALYLEVGYADKDFTDRRRISEAPIFETSENDVTIVPITANIKFEHQITGNLNAYIGGGLGLAWINDDFTHSFTQSASTHASDSDWVFCAQIFAGLSYHVTPQWEVYGGGRWLYLADPTLFGSKQSINDDWVIELGTRYKF